MLYVICVSVNGNSFSRWVWICLAKVIDEYALTMITSIDDANISEKGPVDWTRGCLPKDSEVVSYAQRKGVI